MGTQDNSGYTGYTVLLGYWVNTVYWIDKVYTMTWVNMGTLLLG